MSYNTYKSSKPLSILYSMCYNEQCSLKPRGENNIVTIVVTVYRYVFNNIVSVTQQYCACFTRFFIQFLHDSFVLQGLSIRRVYGFTHP